MSFSLSQDILYFNHAAVSPWPAVTATAVKRFAEENQRVGAANYPQWLTIEKELRDLAAWLINAPSSSSIALLKSTSEALSVVAQGLSWQAGDNIVTFDNEFPSNRIPWQALSSEGVEMRYVDPLDSADPEGALFSLCDENTRLITVSSVQFANGFRCDLERIGTYCKEHNIYFCVDAIQSLGAIPFDVQSCHADFVMADGHKWMMGPEGIALFYCNPEIVSDLRLHQFGWHMVASRGDYAAKSWEPAQDATRFECGSPNMLGIHALHASLSLIKEIGIDSIWNRIKSNTRHMIQRIEASSSLDLLTVAEESRLSGIVTFRPKTVDSLQLHQYLNSKGVICAPRGGGIRFSPHYYNTTEEIDEAFRLVSDFCNQLV